MAADCRSSKPVAMLMRTSDREIPRVKVQPCYHLGFAGRRGRRGALQYFSYVQRQGRIAYPPSMTSPCDSDRDESFLEVPAESGATEWCRAEATAYAARPPDDEIPKRQLQQTKGGTRANEGSKGRSGRERAGQSPRHCVTRSPGPRPQPWPRPGCPTASDVTSTRYLALSRPSA